MTERKIYKVENHPLRILIDEVKNFFEKGDISDLSIPGEKFKVFEDFPPIVSTHDCFDQLFIPPEHPGRQPTDTFYTSKTECLRPHTSVHQIPLMKGPGGNAFLCVGDVYRKDTVDRTHYPAFHQMEGVRIYDFDQIGAKTKEEAKEICKRDLKQVLENLVRHLYGDVEMRWIDEYFPFTDPSIELEIYFNDDWVEVLGSGVILDGVMHNAGLDTDKQVGWAFGLGLERWAMKLFDIGDIRLFWSKDERFIK